MQVNARSFSAQFGIKTAALGAVFCLARSLSAQVFDPNFVINLPNYSMPQNTTATFDIFIQNNDGAPRAVNGLSLYTEVLGAGPTLQAVDILGTQNPPLTIFGAVSNTGQNGTGTGNNGFPHFFYQETATSSGTVDIPAGGPTKIASITFDSTGVAPNQYTYTVNSTFGPSFFTTTGTELYPTINAGTLSVIPEPATAMLSAAALCGVAAVAARLPRKRRAG